MKTQLLNNRNYSTARQGTLWILLSAGLVFGLFLLGYAGQPMTNGYSKDRFSVTSPERGSQGRQDRPPPTASQLTGSISGRVVGESGQPIAEASVTAIPAGSTSSRDPLAALQTRSMLTDENGRFVLDDLRGRVYTISAYAPGYVSTPPLGGQYGYSRPGDSVTIDMVKGGVITGTVTNLLGDPLVGVRVRAHVVRDLNGRATREPNLLQSAFMLDWKTDDRGVYRIYGLQPGLYLVSAGGKGLISLPGGQGGFDNDGPTYFPSGTRDTASEVRVLAGDEVSGIDIRYRDYSGYSIRGTITGGNRPKSDSALMVTLSTPSSSSPISVSLVPFAGESGSFSFSGVLDGEYELAAVGADANEVAASKVRRVLVRGADVSGIELSLLTLGSIGGRILLEEAPTADRKQLCSQESKSSVGDTVILARTTEQAKRSTIASIGLWQFLSTPDAVPAENGEFAIRPLEAGVYQLETRLPSEDWYLRSATLPGQGQTKSEVDITRSGLTLRTGDRVENLTLTVAKGAAAVRGRLVPVQGSVLPERLYVHLIPFEKEASDQVLRFFEVPLEREGTFTIKNVAPGQYWLLPRGTADGQHSEDERRPVAWDANGRAALRHDAERAGQKIDLVPCQRLAGYTLRYAATTTPERRQTERR